jgi:hypothetical protein
MDDEQVCDVYQRTHAGELVDILIGPDLRGASCHSHSGTTDQAARAR